MSSSRAMASSRTVHDDAAGRTSPHLLAQREDEAHDEERESDEPPEEGPEPGQAGKGGPDHHISGGTGSVARKVTIEDLSLSGGERGHVRVDDLFGTGHPPDTVVAAAIAYRMARTGSSWFAIALQRHYEKEMAHLAGRT